MTVGQGGPDWHKLWLKAELRTNSRGHFEFVGDCGLNRLVVEIDPTVTRNFPDANIEQQLLDMRAQIMDAARQKYRDYEAYEEYPAPATRVLRIALTDQDIV